MLEIATPQEIAEWIDYNPETGAFMWKKGNPNGRPRAGDAAGCITRNRRVIRLNKRGYFAARVAWVLMTGEWPTLFIDHENRNTLDDRWTNLRELTRSENKLNTEATDRRIAAGKPARLRLYVISASL